MAIYRPRRGRWPFVAGGLVVGLVAGFAGGLLLVGDRPRDLADAAERIRSALDDAAGLLEVVDIEYREAVVGGQVTNETEFAGARDALARSRERYRDVADALAGIDPRRGSEIDAAYERVQALVEARSPPEDLADPLETLRALLAGEPGS